MPKSEIIVDVAADWVAAVDGGLTPEQQVELDAWLAADARHRVAFKRLEGQYKSLDRLATFRPKDTTLIDPDLPLRPDRGGVAAPRIPRWVWAPVGLAAAAALALAYTGWWRPAHGTVQESAITSVGDIRRLELSDGSVVTVNTDSAVEVNYTSRERHVQLLRGEAHFAVAKNPDRPFIARIGDISVRAVGTAFNIRFQPEVIEVLVTEGMVRVDDTARGRTALPDSLISGNPDEPVLVAGERVMIPVAALAPQRAKVAPLMSAVAVVPPTEMTQRLAWRERRLVFDPTPLRNVVAEFNRYNRVQLKVADETTGGMLVGGAFQADDGETFVRLLETKFGVTADRRDQAIVLKRN